MTDAGAVDSDALTEAEVQRRRELKWVEMLAKWDTYMMRNYKKVRERCRKGIPSSIRPRAWNFLCGAHYHMMNPENKAEFKRLYVSCLLCHNVGNYITVILLFSEPTRQSKMHRGHRKRSPS